MLDFNSSDAEVASIKMRSALALQFLAFPRILAFFKIHFKMPFSFDLIKFFLLLSFLMVVLCTSAFVQQYWFVTFYFDFELLGLFDYIITLDCLPC